MTSQDESYALGRSCEGGKVFNILQKLLIGSGQWKCWDLRGSVTEVLRRQSRIHQRDCCWISLLIWKVTTCSHPGQRSMGCWGSGGGGVPRLAWVSGTTEEKWSWLPWRYFEGTSMTPEEIQRKIVCPRKERYVYCHNTLTLHVRRQWLCAPAAAKAGKLVGAPAAALEVTAVYNPREGNVSH